MLNLKKNVEKWKYYNKEQADKMIIAANTFNLSLDHTHEKNVMRFTKSFTLKSICTYVCICECVRTGGDVCKYIATISLKITAVGCYVHMFVS